MNLSPDNSSFFQVHVHLGPSPVHPSRVQELQGEACHPNGALERGSNLQCSHTGSNPEPCLDPNDKRQNGGKTQGSAPRVCQEEQNIDKYQAV